MGWGHGVMTLPDGTNMEVGYLVKATCEEPGCGEAIDRGLYYRCGGPVFEEGCGHFFCAEHLLYGLDGRQQRCPRCIDIADEDED